jgi:hypothetical protein
MAFAFVARTVGETFKEAARLAGYILNEGTTTAGSTTSATDATNESTPTAQSDEVTGTFFYGVSGDGAGNADEIVTYSTIGVMVWNTAGTSPGTNTKWIRISRRPQIIIDAMADVTRAAAKLQARAYTFEGILTNNLLSHILSGQEWDNGNSSAPTGTTLANANIAREGTIVGFGDFSIKLTGSGAVGTLTRDIPFYALRNLDGQALELLGLMANTTAADGVVRVTMVDKDGTTTTTDFTSTYASNRFEELTDISADFVAAPSDLVSMSVQLRSKNGTNVYFNDIGLYGPILYDYDLPPTMIGALAEIDLEFQRSFFRAGTITRQYIGPALHHGRAWKVIRRDNALTRTLHLTRALPRGLHLRIHGFRAPDVVTATASNVEPNPVWLALATAIHLLEADGPSPRLSDLRAQMVDMQNTDTGNPWRHDHPVWFEAL